MEESLDGLALPTFSGRLSADWDAHEARLTSWLSIRGLPLHAREAAEALELSLTAQAALSFEQEAGLAERRVWDEAVAWCREKWGGEGRKRLAATAALNRLNSRSFRERGSRRENVKDLISELELLFLQAGVVDDEAQRRAFISCFFEFPRALHRLSRTSSYADACAKALKWEGEMVRKERENLTSHLRPIPPSPPSPPQHPQRDPSSTSTIPLPFERPTNPTPGGGSSPVATRPHTRVVGEQDEDVYFRPDDLLDPTDALVAEKNAAEGYKAERRASLALSPRHHQERGDEAFYPARSVETLHAYPSAWSTARAHLGHSPQQQQPMERRAHSSLAAYPSPESLPARHLPSLHQHPHRPSTSAAHKSSCAGTRHRGGFPSFDTPPSASYLGNHLEPPTTPTGSLHRIHTPPFVTEATSFSSTTNDQEGGEGDLLASFPYPSRPSPTHPSFAAYTTQPISASSSSAWTRHLSERRNGSLRGRPPLSPSAVFSHGGGRKEGEEGERGGGGVRKKGTLFGALFGRKGHGRGHGRRKSVDWAFSTGRNREEEGEGRWMGVGSIARAGGGGGGAGLGEGRPPKKRVGMVGGGGGGLPP